jgi:hypothetical protein
LSWRVSALRPRRRVTRRSSTAATRGASTSAAYFAHCAAAGQHKIGFAHHLQARLAELQTGCPFPLALHRNVTCTAPASYEAQAHAHFAEARRSGEWFEVTAAEIDAYIAELEL